VALGKGEVESSIPSGSTSFPKQNQALVEGPRPCPPALKRERDANVPQLLGDSQGDSVLGAFSALQLGAQWQTRNPRWLGDGGPSGAMRSAFAPYAAWRPGGRAQKAKPHCAELSGQRCNALRFCTSRGMASGA
jgi:hypothetical protein